jgi:signal transduction histidine kinase
MIPLPPPSERAVGWGQTIAKYALGLAPFVIVWTVLVVWLSDLLYSKANWSDVTDQATVREWLEETRPFRKTLPELIREYADRRDDEAAGRSSASRTPSELRAELEEQLRVLTEPTRTYESKLPAFPVVYRLEIQLTGASPETITWENPVPRPRQQNQTRVHTLSFYPLGDQDQRAVVVCDYQLHAFNKHRRREQDQRQVGLIAQVVLVAATLVAGVFVYRFLRRELRRENERLATVAAAEHRERELLETRLLQREAEREKEELDRRLLEQKLSAADLSKRADEAEKEALEVKSQLYASIGIMAGSYAHNIKNLLVRPNDLLNRCIESDGLTGTQQTMLGEVKTTLGTVTERLQQILRTVRRDTGAPELTRIDLTKLANDTAATWTDTARDKWKLILVTRATDGPLIVSGDLSHLQQAIENLVFNARDATFEMRNYLREEARRAPAEARKQKLIEAAGWKGEVTVTATRDGDHAVFEVRDNGIGMTDEVRRNCLSTHFTTKRDNAIYEGYSAGMGLGLSFVAMVIERHNATLEITSSPLHGAAFRIRFPLAESGR